jgi:hypothetical protein
MISERQQMRMIQEGIDKEAAKEAAEVKQAAQLAKVSFHAHTEYSVIVVLHVYIYVCLHP